MPRYRKVSVQIWNDEHFSQFTDSAKLAFMFVLTHPQMTSIGAMRHTVPGLANELGWTEKGFREAFAEPLAKGMVKLDETYSLVILPNFLKHNKPENPNVVKSWGTVIELLPECTLLRQYLQYVKGFVEGLGEEYAKGLPEPLSKGMPIPDPDPDPDPLPLPKQYVNTNTDPPYIPPLGGPPVPTNGKPKTRKERKSTKYVTMSPEQETWFQWFWDNYPNAHKWEVTRQSWNNALIDERTFAEIQTAMVWQKPMWAEKNNQYCPGSEVYLNNVRWKDKPKPRVAPKAPGVFVTESDEDIPF